MVNCYGLRLAKFGKNWSAPWTEEKAKKRQAQVMKELNAIVLKDPNLLSVTTKETTDGVLTWLWYICTFSSGAVFKFTLRADDGTFPKEFFKEKIEKFSF